MASPVGSLKPYPAFSQRSSTFSATTGSAGLCRSNDAVALSRLLKHEPAIFGVVCGFFDLYCEVTTAEPGDDNMKKLTLETTQPFQSLPELVANDEGLFEKEGL